MKIIITLLLVTACSTPEIRKTDPVALINCRLENACEKADAVTIENEEIAITQYCSSMQKEHQEFCEQRQLKNEMKSIESTVSDFTFEVHRPLYNLSEN